MQALLDAELRALLETDGAATGLVEPAIRSELFGRMRFDQHGRSLAATHAVRPGGGASFFPRLSANMAAIRRSSALLARHLQEGQNLGPAALWLLDNEALIDEQVRIIRDGMSPGFYRRLPRLLEEPLAGLPRIYGVAWAWVAHTDSGIDEPLLSAYLSAYQDVRPLTLAELWALPSTIRAVLLENLRRLAERIALNEVARDAAHLWFDQPADRQQVVDLDALWQRLSSRGVDEPFLLQLQQRDDELDAARALELTAWLTVRLPDPAGAQARQQVQATEDHQSIRNAITTLRKLDRLNWRQTIGSTSPVVQTLARSPVFAAERDDTQNQTLRAVERLARQTGRSESEVARRLLSLVQSTTDPCSARAAPAYWLHGPGSGDLRQSLGLPAKRAVAASGAASGLRVAAYLGGMLMLAALFTGWLMAHHANPQLAWGWQAWAAVLLAAPVAEAVVAVVNRLISESIPPTRLPRLALKDGLPADQRVMVVMPCVFTSADAIKALCAQLEQHRVANPEAHTQFALLSDWADADQARQADDDTLLQAAREGVARLNARYPTGVGEPPCFLLLHRERRFSETEQRWIGWERKRGKIEQLVQWLAVGAGDAQVCYPFVQAGGLSRPAPNTRHLLCLDADTDLPPGRLRELMGVALHPINRPQLDDSQRRVESGYGFLQPRLVTPLPLPERVTWYHSLFAGQCGTDPYSAATSEVYQDIFNEGTFTGKGLLNVRAVHATLGGRLPQGQVLSHDLLEGALARCAAVSDVTLVEDAPVHADVAASRLHRWSRGDWQLLPFLLRPQAWPMSAISRWKMVDNLRRSLVAPMSLGLLLLVLATGVLPLGLALGAVIAAFCAGPLLGAVAGLAPSRDDISLRLFFGQALRDLGRVLALALWTVLSLFSMAVTYADATWRALWRLGVSRRLLLQWTTAAAAQAAARTDGWGLVLQHRRTIFLAALVAVGATALAAMGQLAMPGATAALLLVWAATPFWIWLVSVPRPVPRRERLKETDREWLRGVAHDTWRFYAQYVGADDHHLPPDNVQRLPHHMVAHRTSPTNIGMYMLGACCAHALGFIGRNELSQRLSLTLDTLEQLPRWHGHFYNWYDTRSLVVLPPSYVSTVDSGNCSGHLLAVAAACERFAEQAPEPGRAGRLLAQSRLALMALAPTISAVPSLRHLAELIVWPWADDAGPTQRDMLRVALRHARHELDTLRFARPVHGAEAGEGAAVYEGQRSMAQRLADHLALLQALLDDQDVDNDALSRQWSQLAQRCRRLACEPDFTPLYDPQRKLLHIGYRVEQQQVDEGLYDLLASESRLTSLLAIGKGDIPAAHWGALGRPFYAWGSEVGLKSWSGSMFEYLMPSLILDEPVGSVLHQAVRSAVSAQIEDARLRDMPWGISESAIAGQDHTLAFQYGPQGVAALALRRTPDDERVVAPYASLMALMVAPRAAVANLRALQALGARHAMGFIEALDYTPGRQVNHSRFVPVATHMAHHQGMALVALTDVLADGLPRHWAAQDPILRATMSLLHEKAPREVAPLRAPVAVPPPRRPRAARLLAECEPLDDALPMTQVLTNGRMSVSLRSHGAGQITWDGVALTRWRDDLPTDPLGLFLMVQRQGTAWHSVTAHPAPDPEARYTCRHLADRTVFEAAWPELTVRTTVWISPEDDCEVREVVLSATGPAPVSLTLASYAEAVLAAQAADESHPAFSNLFVRASWDAEDQALYLHREPRLADEPAVLAAHFLACTEDPYPHAEPVVDRARVLGRLGRADHWLGEGGSSAMGDGRPRDSGDADGAQAAVHATANPTATEQASGAADAQDLPLRLPGRALDTGLDPVMSIRVSLVVVPGTDQRVVFATAAARQLEPLQTLVDRYRQPDHSARTSGMSYTMASIRLRELQLDADTWRALLHLNTLIGSQVTRSLPLSLSPRASERCDRRLLWRHGISGERPLVLVTIVTERGLALVQMVKMALRLWSEAGIGADLVVINAEPASYLSPVLHQLNVLRERLAHLTAAQPAARRGVMHVLNAATLHADERQTLQVLASVRLQADGRSLAQQLERELEAQRMAMMDRQALMSLPVARVRPAPRGPAAAQPPAWEFQGPVDDVVFEVSPTSLPARPWVNVLANPRFGCLVSEAGAGFTWAHNSRMHQVTGWSNDALCDPPAEQVWLHDVDRAKVWPLGQWLADNAPRQIRHGLGFTEMRQLIDGIEVLMTWCVDIAEPVKQVQLVLRVPAGGQNRRLRVVALAEWQLGASRRDRQSVQTRAQRITIGQSGAGLPKPMTARLLSATQRDEAGGFGGATGLLMLRVDGPGRQVRGADDGDWTCDRRELRDRAGAAVLPLQLAQRQGAGLDPCAALGVSLALAAGTEGRITVLLAHADSPEAALTRAADVWPVQAAERLAKQVNQWPLRLGTVQVHTPDTAFDALVNHWLPYQALVCRIWARAGFYQAGGAYGFRDQLQDAMSLVSREPALLAEQIRVHAARQFKEGDVQHWWHEPGGAGVRTHFSDDLLWLPLACALYVARTDAHDFLDEMLPFIEGDAVPEGREDLYQTPGVSHTRATLYEHAARAIDHSLRVGAHGLPLMGSGDWNDGMNRVGHEGRGESVWLAWFLCHVVDQMTPHASRRGDVARLHAWRQARQGWVSALEHAGWDGRWYRRAYFDDGTPLGSAARAECRIDLIAQAWAVISGAGSSRRARLAMDSARTALLDNTRGVLRLLDPPLRHQTPSAGYIQAYPGGVRENGGQYNHAAAWALMAWCQLGQADEAWAAFKMMSPAHRWQQAGVGKAYGIEPYVLAGDIYTQPPYQGRGGWSWYSGSAGWLARAAQESMVGVTHSAAGLAFNPCLPPHWPHAEVQIRHGQGQVTVQVIADDTMWQKARARHPQAPAMSGGETLSWADLGSGQLVLVRASACGQRSASAADHEAPEPQPL